MHSPSKTERLWFSHLLESQTLPSPEDTPLVHFNAVLKKRIHGLLTRSEVFDNFLQLKFPNLKRVRTQHDVCILNITFFSSMALREGNRCCRPLTSCFIQPRLVSFFFFFSFFFQGFVSYNHFMKRTSGTLYLVGRDRYLKGPLNFTCPCSHAPSWSA